jgi:(R)-benzylsuccinyl-CoA dehydrogenase
MTAIAQDAPAAGDVRARARSFVTEDLWPLEQKVLRREMSSREEPFVPQRGIRYRCDPLGVITPGEYDQLLAAASARGLAGLEVSRDLGGQALPVIDKLGVVEEMGKTIVPFVLPPDAPNLHWLEAACSAEQRERYLAPYARGELRSGLALSEEAAGSDVSGIQTRATRTADGWVLNGRKKWIGSADWADFLIVVAVTDEAKGTRGGMTAFLVDRDTPGVVIERRLLTISYQRPCELRLEGVRLGDAQVLGEVGGAFVPLQNRLSLRRLEMAARCVGAADRLLEMMISRA